MDILNPYWSMYMMSDDNQDANEDIFKSMIQRMDALRKTGENRKILYIDSVYVKEDFRQKGMMHLYLDFLKLYGSDSMIWVNLLPANDRLDGPGMSRAFYSAAEIGQLNINAAIAEKLSFTVDTYTELIPAKILNDGGEVQIQEVRSRKAAYYLPKEIRMLIQEDHELVESVRAARQLFEEDDIAEIAFNSGEIDGCFVTELKSELVPDTNEKSTVYCYAVWKNEEEFPIFTASRVSAFAGGIDQDDVLEHYDNLDDATKSDFYDDFCLVTALGKMHKKNENIRNEL